MALARRKEGEGLPLTNVTIRGQAAAAAAIVVGMRALGVPFARDRLCSNCKEVVVHIISGDDDIFVVLRVAGPAGVGLLITLAGG